MTDSQDFDPEEIANAITHSADAHGNNLFRAMSTGAFSRLGLKDQVSVVKRFAEKMPSEQPKERPLDYKSSAREALRGAGEGAATGATTSSFLRGGYWAKQKLNSEERDYDFSEFLKNGLPISVAVGAGLGAARSGASSYFDQKKSREKQQDQFNKLMQIRSESDDNKRNMLALSLLSSAPHLRDQYAAPRAPTPLEGVMGDTSKRVALVAIPPATRPDPVKVVQHQANRTERLAEQHEAANKRKKK